MPDIFISYSREDQAVARRFAQAFEREGFTVWWDQSLTPGEAFDQVTERALDEARAVVVLWSKTSVNSRWVRAEATQANAGPVNVTLWDAAADGRLLIAQTDDRAALIGRRGADTHDEDLSWLDASWIADLSRDGTAILFSESGQGVGARPATYLRGMDGSPAIRLGWGMPLALSPDKRWALMADGELRTDRAGTRLEMVATGAGDSRSIDVGELRCMAARWLPDGQRVILQAAEPGRASRLYLLDVGSGGPQPLSPESVAGWALSPDGSRVAVSGSQSGIRLLALEGGAPHAVPGTERVLLVGWIRDGLLVMRPEEPAAPRGQVYLLDPATGRQRDWANILPSDGAGIMLLVAFAATPDGGARVFTWHRALSNLYIADGIS